ncbi:excalibur calcium-binding domain-containing protein [Geodermatophilus sp. SYSU D00815]
MRRRHTVLIIGFLFAALVCFGLAGTASARDKDCSDFATQQDAQAVLNADPTDPNDLDADDDGTACEALASGLAEDGTPLPGSSPSPTTTTPTTTTTTSTSGSTTPTTTTPAATSTTVAPTTTTTATTTTATTTSTAAVQDLNCSDFATQADAQAELTRDPTDPHNLDADNDGIACETLSNGLAEDNTALPAATTTAATTAAVTSQVSVLPAGGVNAGDGSTADGGGRAIALLLGGAALTGAGVTAAVARRGYRRAH